MAHSLIKIQENRLENIARLDSLFTLHIRSLLPLKIDHPLVHDLSAKIPGYSLEMLSLKPSKQARLQCFC